MNALALILLLLSTKTAAKKPAFDVPAIQVATESELVWQGDMFTCSNGGHFKEPYIPNAEPTCEGGKKWTCANTARVLLTAEDGTRHCILFKGDQ